MRFRYTVTVEADIEESAYPDGVDPMEIERENADEIIIHSLEEGNATVKVEQIQ